MNKEVKYPNFSEIDFMRLYCAMTFKKALSPIIKHHDLEKRLYEFYSLPEFSELFQDICPIRDDINPENSYLDLGVAFSAAQLLGFLIPIYASGEIRSIIFCNEDIAEKIISNTSEELVAKMSNLFDLMFGLDNKFNKKQESILIKKRKN